MENILINFLADNDKYHDHKETMAWTASSIYFLFSIVIINWLITTDFTKIKLSLPFIKVWVIIGFTILYICVICFVYMQFKMRWYAADISIVIRKCLFLCTIEKLFPKKEEFLPINKINNINAFPESIQKQINLLHEERNICNFLVAVISIILLFGIFCGNIDNRFKTEVPTYILITFLFVLKIVLTCITIA